jgi:beta-mannosidase
VAAGDRAAELMPEQHLWGPREDFKGRFYTGSGAHFVSEIGYHGCPARRSLEAMMDREHLWPWQDNDQWLTHATRPHPAATGFDYRIPLMARQIAVLFETVPENLDDFVLASQISQAEAKKFFIEWFRAGKWRRTGILWWNLLDGWPIISDAVVDHFGRRKLAYHYIRRAQADVCAMVGEPVEGLHPVVVVNDTLQDAHLALTVRDLDTGRTLLEAGSPVGANDKAVAGRLAVSAKPAIWLLEWNCAGSRGQNHYLAGPRPFRLADYRRWLEQMGLGPDL